MVGESDIRAARILGVDDVAANVTLLERMLEGAGYTNVESTTDPRAACGLHRENRYDLILLDLQMPDMDGFEVMEGLKAIEVGSYLPVLAVTAQPAHKMRALEGGAKDFVSKPYEIAEVLARVRNLLEVRLLHEESRRLGRELEALALRDPLTGLANRRNLAERMGLALAQGRKNESALALLYLDLDGFKEVNDRLGHEAGDALLKSVASRLLALVREEDTVARLGGDEFMIALWHVTSTDDASLVASKVIEAVARPHDLDGTAVEVTASMGVSLYPDDGRDPRTLMASADRALYAAKDAGKNAFRFADGAVAVAGA